jgi:hypothetical protein
MRFLSVLLLGLLFAAPAQAQTAANYGSAAYSNAALSNAAATIKASPGLLTGVNCYNPNAAVEYLQFYDTASAIVVGTTVPKFYWAIAPTAIGVTNITWPIGIGFPASSLKVAATTTPTGGTGPASALSCTFAFN